MKYSVLWPLAAVLSLAACGGEREEPFNPTEPEVIRDPLAVSFVYEDSRTDRNATYPATDVGSRRIEIIRDSEDFGELIDAYSPDFVSEPDFEEGQVLLYDSGWIDNSACAQQVLLDRVQAFNVTEDESVAELVLTFDRTEADPEAECEGETPFRVYEFHYIETRAHLMLVEEIRGLETEPEDDESSSSSSSSS